jgi:hypothetical protein
MRRKKQMLKEIKWFFQRVFRGYSYVDLWNLNDHLSSVIHKRLLAFKKMKRHGYPSDTTEEEWETSINDMLQAFDIINKRSWFYFENTNEIKTNDNIL